MSVSLINIATRNYTLYSSGISSSSHTMTLKFFWHPILIPKPRTLSVERSKATLIKSTASLCFSPTTYTLKFLEYSPFKTVNSPFFKCSSRSGANFLFSSIVMIFSSLKSSQLIIIAFIVKSSRSLTEESYFVTSCVEPVIRKFLQRYPSRTP